MMYLESHGNKVVGQYLTGVMASTLLIPSGKTSKLQEFERNSWRPQWCTLEKCCIASALDGTEDSTVWENTDIDNSTKYHSKDSGESDPKKLL